MNSNPCMNSEGCGEGWLDSMKKLASLMTEGINLLYTDWRYTDALNATGVAVQWAFINNTHILLRSTHEN